MSVKRNSPKALPHLQEVLASLADALLVKPYRTIEVGTNAETGSPIHDGVVPASALENVRHCRAALDRAMDALGDNLPDSIADPLGDLIQYLEAADDHTLLYSDFTTEIEAAADSMDELLEALRALTPLFSKAEARLDIAPTA